MNLFGIWMENMLPCTVLEKVLFVDSMWYLMTLELRVAHLSGFFAGIDMSKLELCFFPIICRSHWSLFVLWINKDKRVLRLRGKKNYLLYLDSLGLTDPKECLDSLYSALKCLAPHVADSNVQCALYDPAKELDLKIVEVPRQPNGTDCGFYVMTFVRYLIAGILQDGIGKRWLTKDWFQHEDVCKLREELHQWCMKCLGEP